MSIDLDKIYSLIHNGETEYIEYKKSLAELDKLGKSLCGQLNAKGGYGFIGITDSGKIVGTEVTDSTKKKLTTFKDYFDPWPHIEIDYVEIPNSTSQVIVFSCKRSPDDGPYTFRGKPYLKTPSGVKAMPSEKYKNLLLEHAGLSKSWESFSVNNFSLADLDHEEIIKTFKSGVRESRIPEDENTEDITEILTHFDLLHDDIINNAAMVLYAKKMPADFSQCFIRMGRFVDETMDDVIDSKQLRGNAFQILNEAVDFVRRHLPISSRYDSSQLERIDEMALPPLAIREAIINAICHRDYSSRAGDISLYIFNDSLEIHNIGHLYGGLTIDQLRVKHPSRRRNERIAQVFHARKFIDRFGGGTRRILRLCAEQALPEPVFSEEGDGFQIKFFFKEPIGARKESQVIEQDLSPRQIEIINILGTQGGLTTKMLRDNLTNPPTERWLRDELKTLSKKEIVRAEGATTNRKWILIKK
ncbi:ATP-binding protein [Legionella pneumophila]|nr:ATP-binding protein [Legionella pneumophila]MDO5216262.1 ATP-binding protein [Legionella pneumophila]